MKIDLANLGSEPVTLSLVSTQEDASELFESLKLDGELQGTVNVDPRGGEVYALDVHINGVQKLICVRTLEPFLRPFRVDFQAEVQKASELGAPEFEDREDDVFLLRVPQNQFIVDLTECVRQQVILQEPMSPVADPDSEFAWTDTGIAKEPDPGSSPWAKLREWKERNSND